MFFIINEKNKNLFWNNENGWGSFDTSDSFSIEEKVRLNLPQEGVWVSAWEVDTIQFARLIAECEACGVFADEERMMQVADEMDLEMDELFGIIDRAMNRFEQAKEKI